MATKKTTSKTTSTTSATPTPAAIPALAPELKATPVAKSTTPATLPIPAKLPARKSAATKKSTQPKASTPLPAPAEKALVPTEKTVTPTTPEKIKKPKLVRDSFTIPKAEYVVIDGLKERAAQLTRPIKKSELLRAGIKLLAALPDDLFLVALEQVPALKTGRPGLEK